MPNYKRYFIKNSMVFITIVTKNREPILIDNIALLKNAIKETRYTFKIIAFVILPDHLHIIIKPEKMEEFPKIISSIKYYFSRNYNYSKECELSLSQINRREKGIWQRRYYDHIIRNEEDLFRHFDYIHFNPMKHLQIIPKDWKYSSFMRFAKSGYYDKDWCNFNDLYKITEMNLE